MITPSHNPPHDGGFRYNAPHGGPAEPDITRWIEATANARLEGGLQGVRRMPVGFRALRRSTTHRHDYLGILTHAPGNGAPIGGLKMIAESGWFAARPSGTESTYKIYGESFSGPDHLRRILEDAQSIVDDALAGDPPMHDAGRAVPDRTRGA